jgi:hypothetical protein
MHQYTKHHFKKEHFQTHIGSPFFLDGDAKEGSIVSKEKGRAIESVLLSNSCGSEFINRQKTEMWTAIDGIVVNLSVGCM